MLQQQGIIFDATSFLRIVAQLSNSPELEDILKQDTGVSLLGQDQPIDEQRQSPVTLRNYVRRSAGQGGNGAQGGQGDMQQWLSQGQNQQGPGRFQTGAGA
jgi:hypothetical protein